MKISMMSSQGLTLAQMVSNFSAFEEAGLHGSWVGQFVGHDVLTAMPTAMMNTTTLTSGTFVVPTYPRHPIVMAQQALTVSGACGGRFTLGIGLSHAVLIERSYGLKFEKPIRHMREYLEVINALMKGEAVRYSGTEYNVNFQLETPDAQAPSVVIAALGPQMLRLAGRLADGTATWMAGQTYLENTVMPEITASAAKAGRPAPRVIAGIPTIVTDDADAAREKIAKDYAVYATIPSYRRCLEGGGESGPAAIAIAGNEAEVERELNRFRDIGVTEFVADVIADPETTVRTRTLLGALNSAG